MFNKKYKITLLNFKWEPIIRSIKINVIPRSGEFIYVKEGLNSYYEVLNVIHDLSNNDETFIIVRKYDRKIKKSVEKT